MGHAEAGTGGTRARFFVDEDLCIGCGLCRERAPNNIELSPGGLHASIFKQPTSRGEEAACEEAAEYCPTGGLHTTE